MSDNTKSGFRDTEIFPFKEQKVINKLPNRSEEDELIEDLE